MTGFEINRDVNAERERAILVLGGVSLGLFGLTRGSWVGLALAATGGFLVYHGLRRPPRRFSREPARIPSADSPNADAFLRQVFDTAPEARADAVEPAPSVPSSDVHALVADGRLTPEEQGRVEVVAYFHALERGGGRLPPYDTWQAEEDFRRAAAQIRRGS